MARILLQADSLNSESANTQTNGRLLSDRELLKKRSEDYIKHIQSIDTELLAETKGKDALMKKIYEEFGTAELSGLPLGIVAKCYLGHPHEVHTLDLNSGQIIRHYKIAEMLPEHFEKARTLAKHDSYAFVEVYPDKLILIRKDGTASKL